MGKTLCPRSSGLTDQEQERSCREHRFSDELKMDVNFCGLQEDESFGTPPVTSTQASNDEVGTVGLQGRSHQHKEKKRKKTNADTSAFDPKVAEERWATFMAEEDLGDSSVLETPGKKKKKKRKRKRSDAKEAGVDESL